MKICLVTAFLIGILIGVGICCTYFWWIDRPIDRSDHHVQVGAFYYLWYDQNEPTSWEYPKICDSPILGYYNSCNPQVIEQHFAWLSDLKIDFFVVSWWGSYNQSNWHRFVNEATHQIFRVARENVTNVKTCIMVEAFINKTQYPALNYDYTEIYDYVYDNFVIRYPTVYYQYEGKPLICFYNDQDLTPNGSIHDDDRFVIKIVGQESYVDWVYTDLTQVTGSVPRNGQIPVTPRFDDSRFRYPNYTMDTDLSEGVYDEQWERAISLAGKGIVDVITICSWNEYPERTAIEPHWDADAYDHDPYFLYTKTKKYMAILKEEWTRN